MGRYLPIVMVALLMIYCVVEAAQSSPYAVRGMPRWLWAVTIICLPLAGAVLWLVFGRPRKDTKTPGGPPRSPDDDPDFLRGL
ncbi:MAG: PLD nuclease N-terminal domain-containing protein [Propionibacteriaceae bacterium]